MVEASATSNGLDVFVDPASVAVVGATDNPAKWGFWLAQGALAGEDRRTVSLVNRRGGHVLGRAASADLSSLPGVPELVGLAVPGAQASAVVDEALDLGVRGFVNVAGSLPDEQHVVRKIRAAGARMIGPNSLGLVDTHTGLFLAWGIFAPGPMAVVTQSGQVGSELVTLGATEGLGVSRFVSVGNQTDVGAAEMLEQLVGEPSTRVLAVYLESFEGSPRLIAAMRRLRRAGQWVLVLTIGESVAAQRAARSHTGSMTSPLDAVDAACAAAGALRVESPRQLIETALLLAQQPERVRGRRIGVVGDSGGQGALAADVLTSYGLELPAFGSETVARLGGLLPPQASVSNPVDLAGAGEADLHAYARVADVLLGSHECDAVVLTGYFGRYVIDTPSMAASEAQIAEELAAASRRHDCPLLVHTMGPTSATSSYMRELGIAAFEAIDGAATALAGAVRLAGQPGRVVPEAGVAPDGRFDDFWSTRQALERRGVAFPQARWVGTREQVGAAGAVLRAPFVLKAAWLAHKTEHDGVRLGLRSADALLEAYDEMAQRLGDHQYLVEEQDRRSDVQEMIVGGRWVPDIGPVVVVGAGGVTVELDSDTVMEVAPVEVSTARGMIERLRCAPLLEGWRGRPAVDVDALAEVVVTVSQVLASRPDISEIEINPVRVSPNGALAVDVLAVVAGQQEEA